VAQAVSVRQLLRAPVLAVGSSPLTRARASAALLRLEVPVEVDDRWVEIDYGEYECQPLRDVPADVWLEWRRDPDYRPGGGETLSEVETRVATACETLFADPDAGARSPDGDVVVVSHVTPIKAAVAWALGMGQDLSWRLHLNTASVTRIGWSGESPVLHGYNQVAPTR
jgi:broad specificity phosphatase PhoE